MNIAKQIGLWAMGILFTGLVVFDAAALAWIAAHPEPKPQAAVVIMLHCGTPVFEYARDESGHALILPWVLRFSRAHFLAKVYGQIAQDPTVITDRADCRKLGRPS